MPDEPKPKRRPKKIVNFRLTDEARARLTCGARRLRQTKTKVVETFCMSLPNE